MLEHRLQEADNCLNLFDEFESTGAGEWPPGAKFVLGFGRTMMQATKEYIGKNRHMLFEQHNSGKKTATG